ncbi:FAA hydrolase family protein [Helicobacter aurati]|uniref:FAA hydrolase family protein n=1 Tax=Helicobacter aurati TaxID=137778 RepID=A0A3D8J1E1_9HELI|nr:fumarylacetoacetate hydrolase family protein [Helicobacter aurati]RDU71349.1 FAA hydrolase family protein [Helicobacter aurati]
MQLQAKLKGKLIRYLDNGIEFLGILKSDSKNKDSMVMPLDITNNMNEFILHFEKLKGCLQANNPLIPLENVTLLSPIKSPLQDIICLGINYMDHAKESMRFKKESFDGKREQAVYFGKRVNECANPNASFYINNKTSQLDYEVELVVIIGRDCMNATRENAMNFVFGYSIANDISARDLQLKHKQWYAGKSLEGSFPLGPCIVLRDSLNPHNLAIKSYVNGELRQQSSTSKLIFDIPHVICELSSYFTLKAGSIISMGTPSGVGMGFEPPRFLQAGDIVKCEIENIGTLQTFINV